MSQANLIEQLTDKQCEALEGVWQRLSSKEIARKLDISPRSVDQRLDAARRILGAADRYEAARVYASAKQTPYALTSEQFTVSPDPLPGLDERRTSSSEHVFHDALTFKERAPWDSFEAWSVSEVQPSDLNPGLRLFVILGGSIGIVFLAGAVAGLYSLVEGILLQ